MLRSLKKKGISPLLMREFTFRPGEVAKVPDKYSPTDAGLYLTSEQKAKMMSTRKTDIKKMMMGKISDIYMLNIL
jgi:hypothetical protein